MTRTALITGAGRGIGRAIARRFAADGWALELTDVLADDLAATVEELSASVAVCGEPLDLRDRPAQDAWIESVRGRHETLDALVHNAGVGGPDAEDEDDFLAHLEHVIAVNVTAVMRLTRGLLDLVPKDGSGRIVVLGSVLGKMGVPRFSAYCASKAATLGFVRALALDLARHRITVNAICPGWTDTAMARQGFEAIAAADGITPEEARANVEKGLPLGRIVQPEEIAGLAAFLAGPDAGAMSGQAITMSAGDLQR